MSVASESTGFEAAQRRVFEAAGIDPESRFVDLDDPAVRIHVSDVEADDGSTTDGSTTDGSTTDDGPPLLFVHGGGTFGAAFAPLMAHLGNRRLLAIDRPGYGLSGDFAYTAENHRRTATGVLEGVLDDLGVERVDLVGNSTGGYWAVVFALARPDRVRRLTLLGSVPTFPGTNPPVPLRLFTVGAVSQLLNRLQEPGEDAVVQQFETFGEGETIQQYPALVQAVVAQNRTDRAADVGHGEFKSLMRLRGWRPATRLRTEELAELAPPTLLVWGEDDPLGSPEDVRAGVEAVPDARIEAMDTGHLPWFGRPEECARLIREWT